MSCVPVLWVAKSGIAPEKMEQSMVPADVLLKIWLLKIWLSCEWWPLMCWPCAWFPIFLQCKQFLLRFRWLKSILMSQITENYLPSPSTLKAGFRHSPCNVYLSRRAVLVWFVEMSSRNFDRCFGCACRLWFGDPSWNWTMESIGNLEINRKNKSCIREKKQAVFSAW